MHCEQSTVEHVGAAILETELLAPNSPRDWVGGVVFPLLMLFTLYGFGIFLQFYFSNSRSPNNKLMAKYISAILK